MKKAQTMREAMLAGGYSQVSVDNPKNFTDSRGFQILMEEYRNDLIKAGATPEMLAEIQVEGLFSQDDRVRLEYIKETKKDFGLFQPDNKQTNIVVGIVPKKNYEY